MVIHCNTHIPEPLMRIMVTFVIQVRGVVSKIAHLRGLGELKFKHGPTVCVIGQQGDWRATQNYPLTLIWLLMSSPHIRSHYNANEKSMWKHNIPMLI